MTSAKCFCEKVNEALKFTLYDDIQACQLYLKSKILTAFIIIL